MHIDRINQAEARGFDRVQAQRLAFVRWSRLGGYAHFMEKISSDDDQVVDTRAGFEVDRKEVFPTSVNSPSAGWRFAERQWESIAVCQARSRAWPFKTKG